MAVGGSSENAPGSSTTDTAAGGNTDTPAGGGKDEDPMTDDGIVVFFVLAALSMTAPVVPTSKKRAF